jgi:hypothetical protein
MSGLAPLARQLHLGERRRVMDDRELDALVAEKVMGYIPIDIRVCDGTEMVRCYGTPGDESLQDGAWSALELRNYYGARPYSTDIANAFLVVEAMRTKHKAWPIEIESDRYGGVYSGGEWNVVFNCVLDKAGGDDFDAGEFWASPPNGAASDNSLSRAICRAALSALGIDACKSPDPV